MGSFFGPNSIKPPHAQREAREAFIRGQTGEGWRLIETAYDDGGFSGGTLERPALQRLFADIAQHRVDTVVVYKVDRLTRSLMDFAKMVELFDRHGVTFVAVIQQFNTTTSMGRLTLNILLSFAQFEREVIGERVRPRSVAPGLGCTMGGVGKSGRLVATAGCTGGTPGRTTEAARHRRYGGCQRRLSRVVRGPARPATFRETAAMGIGTRHRGIRGDPRNPLFCFFCGCAAAPGRTRRGCDWHGPDTRADARSVPPCADGRKSELSRQPRRYRMLAIKQARRRDDQIPDGRTQIGAAMAVA
jgi:hypothetical protein